jgi:hypothetical protein
MKRAALTAVAVLSLLIGACGDGDRTNCAIARENLDQCMTEVFIAPSVASFQRLPLVIDDDCSGTNACAASCVKEASCEAMRLVLLGRRTDPNAVPISSETAENAGRFNVCLNKCIDER